VISDTSAPAPGQSGSGLDTGQGEALTGNCTGAGHDPETARLLHEADRQNRREARRDDAYARREKLPVVGARLSDITPKAVHWLWSQRFARSKVSLIAGDPGLGKSQLAASLAAIVTTGSRWPVDRTRCETGNVILLSAEDDPADTIVPRLQAAGADLTRVETVEAIREFHDDGERQRPINLIDDLDALEDKAHVMGDCALVIIDPISAFLGAGRVDSHNNTDVRGVMQGLQRFAERTGAAVICVSHLSKGKHSDVQQAVMGSVAFVAGPRAAFVICRDDPDSDRRLFLPIKNNIGNDKTGLAFRIESAQIEDGISTSRVVWEAEHVTQSANEIYAEASGGDRTATDEAVEFLEQLLADGPVPAKEAKRQATEAGLTERPLRTARQRLGIKPRKRGFDGAWEWALPVTEAPKLTSNTQDDPKRGGVNLEAGGQLPDALDRHREHLEQALAGTSVSVDQLRAELSDDDLADFEADTPPTVEALRLLATRIDGEARS